MAAKTLEQTKTAGIHAQLLNSGRPKVNPVIPADITSVPDVPVEATSRCTTFESIYGGASLRPSVSDFGDPVALDSISDTAVLTSGYGERIHPVTKKRSMHYGIDVAIAGRKSSNIIASKKGIVTIARFSETAGNFVVIKHAGGGFTKYMHMNSLSVNVDQEVVKGTVLGRMGSTGTSTGIHLHYQIHFLDTSNKNAVDPSGFLPADTIIK